MDRFKLHAVIAVAASLCVACPPPADVGSDPEAPRELAVDIGSTARRVFLEGKISSRDPGCEEKTETIVATSRKASKPFRTIASITADDDGEFRINVETRPGELIRVTAPSSEGCGAAKETIRVPG